MLHNVTTSSITKVHLIYTWAWLEPFFFFLDLADVFMWAGMGSVLRPGMITMGGGITKVSILKLVMLEYPGVGDWDSPGM